MPHCRAYYLPLEKQRQDERENPELHFSGHAPPFPVHPDSSYTARLQLYSVLSPSPVIGVDPNGLVLPAPFDDLRVLRANLSSDEVIPYELQSLGDCRNK